LPTQQATHNPQQLSKVEGGLKDFSTTVEAIKQEKLRRLEVFCCNNII
jgi:hypothetical protein